MALFVVRGKSGVDAINELYDRMEAAEKRIKELEGELADLKSKKGQQKASAGEAP